MDIKYEELEKDLSTGALKPLYLLYGEETYLIDLGLKKIKKNFGELVQGINFVMIDENNCNELIANMEVPAFGYDKKLTRALYKALQSSGMKLVNYGTIFLTIADDDKEDALPLIRRFYNLGFNIEATEGTANFLKKQGIRTRIKKKISEGSEEILDSILKGYVSYVINTRNINSIKEETDGSQIRRCAVENNIPTFTALDTVKVLLDVLEEITLGISTIDE